MRENEKRARAYAKELRGRLTNAETILWSRLRRGALRDYRFRRQHPIGAYIADFACVSARVVVEVDGATHCSNAERIYDRKRETYLHKRGWHVVRVWNGEVYENLNGVLELIYREVSAQVRRLPPPPRALRSAPPP